ncbi:hypothetical protein GH714_026282 [Hevea brasiliensis]|uniref:Wall-associated receptor kinase galacturonan-binding domain-containing protein n=1 Tax=Hevea brasiliensis TaxID=3981 RepID=A0A6A6LN63_HEVBR|nr:hypothetical protein GH714_026282 [Hevea brasiliensis]
MSKLKCKDHCGNISIPYPFGMGNKDCYFNEWFEIKCNESAYPPTAFIASIEKEVFYIDVDGRAIVRSPIISSNCSGRKGDEPINLTGSPFYISTWNSFIAVGCDIRALLMDDPLLRIGNDCNGTDCCKTSVPSSNQKVFHPIFNQSTDGCKLAFLAIDGGRRFDQFLVPRHPYVQFLMLLDWTINSTLMRAVDNETADCYNNAGVNASEFQFKCRCRESGYEGNPYIGCAGKITAIDSHDIYS